MDEASAFSHDTGFKELVMDFPKDMDFIDKYAKIKDDEKTTLMELLTRKEDGIMLREALLQEGRAEGIQKGREEGIEKGIEKGKAIGAILGKLEIVQEMLDKGIISNEAFQQISTPLQTELTQLQASINKLGKQD